MRPPSDEFEAYLAPGESVLARTAATLSEGSFRSGGVVGVTDRRVLFVGESGRFVDVAHGAIGSIRSRPRRGFDYRGMGPVLSILSGTVVAGASFLGVLVVEPSALAFVLAVVTVGGVAAAERVRRAGVDIEWHVPKRAKSVVLDRVSSVERLRTPIARAGTGGDPDLLVLGIVTVALSALVGLVAASGSLLVVPLALATVGGAALAERGYRRELERDETPRDGPPGGELSVHLVDGSVLHLRVGPEARFERELSAAVRESPSPTATAELPRP